MSSILERASVSDGFYDGCLEALPWSFWVQELTLPEEDVSRMLRIWNGEYLSYRRHGGAPCFRHLYTFRDRSGRLGTLSVSDNMGFQYFRWFRDVNHLNTELERLGEPVEYQRGLPTPTEVRKLELSKHQREQIVAATRSIVAAYLSGDNYSDGVGDLVVTYQQFLNGEKSSAR